MNPSQGAPIQAAQTEIGILVIGKDVIRGKAAYVLEPAPLDRHEGAADRRYRPRPAKGVNLSWGPFAVMLDAPHRAATNFHLPDRYAPIDIQIHAGMHQRAVGVEQPRSEKLRLFGR